MKSFWILNSTSKVRESTRTCVVKYTRAWLPSEALRGGLACQTRTCMGTFMVAYQPVVRACGVVFFNIPMIL
jgi:hypothetical protein